MAVREIEKRFSSQEFLTRLKSRDHSAISELVHAYTEQLLRAGLGLGFDHHAAAELVQNVWATLFDVIGRFEGKSHIRTYLFGILYNRASEQRRHEKKFSDKDPVEDILDQRLDSTGHQWLKPPISPEDFLIGAETMELIESCLDDLPLNQRMAFSLKEIEEEDTPEICKILDVTVTNLGVLLFRARNRLRECIEGKVRRK